MDGDKYQVEFLKLIHNIDIKLSQLVSIFEFFLRYEYGIKCTYSDDDSIHISYYKPDME